MKAMRKILLAALLGLVVCPVFAGGGNDIIIIITMTILVYQEIGILAEIIINMFGK